MNFPAPDPLASRALPSGFPTGTTLLTARAPTVAGRHAAAAHESVPEQLLVQPVEHRRPEHHQQLPGRRRHLRPRLGAQHPDRQQPGLQQRRERSRAASTSARANSRRCTWEARRPCQCGSGLLREQQCRESGAAVLLRHERQRPQQRDHAELLHRRRAVLGHAGGSGRRQLLHRFRLLQVQLQLGVRQPEHAVTAAASAHIGLQQQR